MRFYDVVSNMAALKLEVLVRSLIFENEKLFFDGIMLFCRFVKNFVENQFLLHGQDGLVPSHLFFFQWKRQCSARN